MKARYITTAVGIPLIFAVLYFYHTVAFNIVMAAACIIGFYEAFSAYAKTYDKNPPNTVPLLIILSVLAAVNIVGPGGLWQPNQYGWLSRVSAFLALAAVIVYTVMHFEKIKLASLCGSLVLCIMLYFCFSTVIWFKQLYPKDTHGYLGAFLVLLALAYAWGGDSFAYLAGRAFGKKKLCPHISPNKTVAGAIGALFGSAVFGLLFLWLFGLLMPVIQPQAVLAIPSWVYWAVAAAAIPASILGMLGDLFASCIKRQVGIKDYGTLLPGQGGILDRFDSAIPVMTFVGACVAVFLQ